ncbi:hypothetical protein J2125_000447 [Erwinia toletana]|uniref:Uncharacterized protein n=1 Tax=Winslowiella toletana TaxID=92490 RepID=A0ABS4P3M5_9GAMM|nr:hypothetical protein [Winslowiella toletana]MBP2167255.1 hypothetical protein [Winslowiella toletana]
MTGSVALREEKFLFSWQFHRYDREMERLAKFIKESCHNRPVILKITVYAHNGGYITVMKKFITAVEMANEKNIKVELIFSGFAISAAAYLFSYFNYHRALSNVRVSAGSNLCVVYHKPRLIDPATSEIVLFATDVRDPANPRVDEKVILDLTADFDKVFSSMCKFLARTGRSLAPHLLNAYNLNGDVAIPFLRGEQKKYEVNYDSAN